MSMLLHCIGGSLLIGAKWGWEPSFTNLWCNTAALHVGSNHSPPTSSICYYINTL